MPEKSESAKIFEGIMNEALGTFKDRNAIYQDGWVGHGKAMKAFFPVGIELETAEDFSRFLLFEMCVSKLNRYAANFSEGGHQDSIRDEGVYAFLLETFDTMQLKKEPKT